MTLILESDVMTTCIFFTSSSKIIQGDILCTLSAFPPSSRIAYFVWNSLVESHLRSSTPFQIKAKVNLCMVQQCIIVEGDSSSILSPSSWKGLGSPNLLLATNQLLAFD